MITPCPTCKNDLEVHTCVSDASDTAAVPGDLTVCIYCGAFLMFDEDLYLELCEDPSKIEGVTEDLIKFIWKVKASVVRRIQLEVDDG